MINNLELFSIENLALLSDWLDETGELYVDVYVPRSANSGQAFLIRSMGDLKALVIQQHWRPVVFTMFRQLQYSLRGIADQQLLDRALEIVPEGSKWGIIHISYYPDDCNPNSGYTSHLDLRHELTEVFGEKVGVGLEPPCLYTDICDPNEVFQVTVLRQNDFRVAKNQDEYERYRREPERYSWLKNIWQAGT